MKPTLLAGALFALAFASIAAADHEGPARADEHAPIGVMGDHVHDAGEWMFSYRFMRMEMDGSRDGTDGISPEEIVTIVANPNAPPPTLRVVPLDMTMDMHMFGVMYAPSDRVTLMGMVNYLQNEMDHVTFQGMAGTTELGGFTTESEGFGDTKVSALIVTNEGARTKGHLTLGLSLPTGSIDETDDVLTPMNTTPTLTLPYPMQLGSGTVDPIIGYTLNARASETVAWGVQGTGVFRLMDNDEDYRLGDELHATAWASYSLAPSFSVSGRVAAMSKGQIDGRDVRIAAPVQTADPDNQGGERVDLGVGVNWIGRSGALKGHRLAAEVVVPVYQDLNGPQLETDAVFTIGWQRAFGG